MMRLILLVGFLIAGVALAGDPLAALAGIASSGSATQTQLGQLSGARWTGGYTDPLAGMVDWGAIDPSACMVGQPPPGWSQLEGVYKLILTNNTTQALRIEVDHQAVDVLDAKRYGETQVPMMVLASTSTGIERFTVLRPGAMCYGTLLYKGVPNKQTKWQAEAIMLGYHGGAGRWLDIGRAFLFTAPLYPGKRSRVPPVYYRGQSETKVDFNPGHFR